MTVISVADLAACIDDADVVVCDVRFSLADHDQGRRDYATGHLPGARFVDLHTDLADTGPPPGRGRHPLPSVDRFTGLLGTLGVTPGSLVVAYDAAGGATASRLWWMLRSIGHGRAAVLDGGYPAWVGAGHRVTTDVAVPTPAHYPDGDDWTGIVSADDVAQALELGGTVVDARAPERYRGEVEPLDSRAGHIPGAINRFHAANVADDGTLRDTSELVGLLAGIGERPIVYCGSGVTACHALLAMGQIGINEARLYPGSWSEWSSDGDRPVATGPDRPQPGSGLRDHDVARADTPNRS